VEFNQPNPDFTLYLQASVPLLHAGVTPNTYADNSIHDIPFGDWFSGPISSADAFMNNINAGYGGSYGLALGRLTAHEFGHWALQLVHQYFPRPGEGEQGIMSQGDLSGFSPAYATFLPSQVPRLQSLCNQLHPTSQGGTSGGGTAGASGGGGSYGGSWLEQWVFLNGLVSYVGYGPGSTGGGVSTTIWYFDGVQWVRVPSS
jgi:hypothetical protein